MCVDIFVALQERMISTCSIHHVSQKKHCNKVGEDDLLDKGDSITSTNGNSTGKGKERKKTRIKNLLHPLLRRKQVMQFIKH